MRGSSLGCLGCIICHVVETESDFDCYTLLVGGESNNILQLAVLRYCGWRKGPNSKVGHALKCPHKETHVSVAMTANQRTI